MGISFSNFGGTSSSTGTGFNLDVGSSGNNTFVFGTAQDAGGYSITSQLADATIEFYAIAEDGTLAGYTNTKALTASKAFNKLVVYGATNNDLITFEFKPTTLPTSIGQESSGAAPFIASVSDADLANIDDTTIITGGNFATDVAVTFTGTDLVVRNAKSIVRTNSTQLIVTRPDDFLEDNSPYTIEVSNPGIPQSAFATTTANVTAGGDPVWSTNSGALASGISGVPYSTTLLASDPDGGTISYSVVDGSLPTGYALDSATGIISGTASGAGSFNFTVSAIDPNGNSTNRSFSISTTGSVSGGLVTYDGADEIHTFNSNDTLQVLADTEVTYLVVAGGGGGGFDVGGGGGAGGYLSGTTTLAAGSYNITVGGGGSGATSNTIRATKGGNSSIGNTVVAEGGGYGGNWSGSDANYRPGGNGGSGGGGGGWNQSQLSATGGTGIPGQGNNGGYGGGGNYWTGGGGGGAGGNGSNAASTSSTGSVSGGPGLSNSISGNPVTYAAGGRGSNDQTGVGNAPPNLGRGADGGGTGGLGNNGPSGGSGIVIVRYTI